MVHYFCVIIIVVLRQYDYSKPTIVTDSIAYAIGACISQYYEDEPCAIA